MNSKSLHVVIQKIRFEVQSFAACQLLKWLLAELQPDLYLEVPCPQLYYGRTMMNKSC